MPTQGQHHCEGLAGERVRCGWYQASIFGVCQEVVAAGFGDRKLVCCIISVCEGLSLERMIVVSSILSLKKTH